MTNDEVLKRFGIKPEFGTAWKLWDLDQKQLFRRLASAIHNTGLDWYHVKGKGAFRFGCKNPDDKSAFSVAGYTRVRDNHISVKTNVDWEGKQINAIPQNNWTRLDVQLMQGIEDELTDWDGIPDNLRKGQDGLWPDQFQGQASQAGQETESRSAEVSLPHSLNTILYGPPGTGKTYATFRRCVEICDEAAPPDDKAVGDRYRKLVEEGRVEFVTFHQSYGYEEFVEGLQPHTESTDTEAGSSTGFRLDPKDGVLKRIADRARKVSGSSARYHDLHQSKVFKMGLGNPLYESDEGIFEECINNGYILIDVAREVNWTNSKFNKFEKILDHWKKREPNASGKNPNVEFINSFRNRLSVDDIVIVPAPQQRFRAVGRVTGPYRYVKRDDGSYPHRREVQWLWSDSEGMPISELYDYQITPQTIYRMSLGSHGMERLRRYAGQEESSERLQPHVLVIDEINRGNISKVFGEAITLVEEDKRAGKLNEISVTLPYSGKPFTLPPNLYILGTMNTADRSIALLDTALRRRFDFEELAPKPKLLREAAETSGIDLPIVLKAMNARLEWLLSRDYLIGHAWLIDARSKDEVDRIMRHKIIPMLAEYFHEDWNRVRAVLGGGDGFIEKKKLGAPPELDNVDIGEDRYRWTIREDFRKEAYDRLIAGQARQDDARDDGTEDDNA